MDQIDTHATAIAAQEVAHLEPGATVELDADVTAFPTPFSQLKPGRYEYKYVLEGKTWRHDPGNPQQAESYYKLFLKLSGDEPLEWGEEERAGKASTSP